MVGLNHACVTFPENEVDSCSYDLIKDLDL